MRNVQTWAMALMVGVSMSVALAQPGGGKGPGAGAGPMGAGPAASATGMGMGMGPGGGRGAARWGSDHTAGWSLMSQQERNEHRDRMRSMKSYEECKVYREQHHELMAARAKERGGKVLAPPRRDACAGLKQ